MKNLKTDKIITLAELTIHPEFVEEVLPLANDTRKHILLEEGCESFSLLRKTDNPNVLVIFATYTSKQTYEWHLEQEYVKQFFAFLEGKLTEEPRMSYLEEL